MTIPRSALIAALIVAVAIRSNVPARGEPPVIRVSADGKGDYGKIQDAVDSAPAGAVVRIAERLMISFLVIMSQEFTDGMPQHLLTEEYPSRQTF